MNKKEINYESILHVFEGDHDCLVHELINETAGSIYDFEDEIDADKAFNLTVHQEEVAFALGFTFGKMFDLGKSEEEAMQTVDQIWEILKESTILPYLPIAPKKTPNSCPGNSAPVTPTP